ncbi:MAG TPA: hypothetical protein PLJ47_00495, partial [Candidatus Hydrogenedentes bacterium]|nr:hypothetical protein [Candidatus Hydrogenedentota bacterium]
RPLWWRAVRGPLYAAVKGGIASQARKSAMTDHRERETVSLLTDRDSRRIAAQGAAMTATPGRGVKSWPVQSGTAFGHALRTGATQGLDGVFYAERGFA